MAVHQTFFKSRSARQSTTVYLYPSCLLLIASRGARDFREHFGKADHALLTGRAKKVITSGTYELLIYMCTYNVLRRAISNIKSRARKARTVWPAGNIKSNICL